MTRFMLIPGAWLGAWAWREVVPHLTRAGHSAVPITLTGMGDRVHLATPEVGMATAVLDVVNAIKFSGTDDFVLVGHSFAGKVAAVVANRERARVRKVVYLDSFRPERVREPQGGFDPANEFGPPPAGSFAVGLTEEIVRRIGPDVTGPKLRELMSLATPWPTRLAKDPISLTEEYDSVSEAYIFCSRSGDPVDEIVAGKWGKLEGPHRILDAGHWPMLTKPEELARDLVALAG